MFFLINVSLIVELFVALDNHVRHWAGLLQRVSLVHLTSDETELPLNVITAGCTMLIWALHMVNSVKKKKRPRANHHPDYLLIWPTIETLADSRFLICPLLTLKYNDWGKKQVLLLSLNNRFWLFVNPSKWRYKIFDKFYELFCHYTPEACVWPYLPFCGSTSLSHLWTILFQTCEQLMVGILDAQDSLKFEYIVNKINDLANIV